MERTEQKTGRGDWHRAGIGANVSFQILLAALVLVLVNWLGMRHYHRFDWTSGNIYTLSEQTENVLGALPRDVEVIVMMSQGNPLFAGTRELLDRYRAVAGPKLNVRYVDPDQNPVEFRHILEQYPIAGSVNERGEVRVEQVVIVNAGDTTRFVTPSEEFLGDPREAMFGGPQQFNSPKAEESLTSAIYRVISGRQRVICFSSGHGEWSLSAGDRGLSGLSDRLERFEVELRSVELSLDSPPDFSECHAVVVAGPRQPFLPEEARHLERYVIEDGGDLVLLLDPIVRDRRFLPTGLEDLARRLGFEVEQVEVVDSEASAPYCGGGHPTAFIAGMPIPGTREALPVCVVRARSISFAQGREGESFLQTVTESAYGELEAGELTNPTRDESDLSPPLILGAAVVQNNEAARTARLEAERAERGDSEVEAELDESERRGSMVLVLGDSDFLDRDLRRNGQLSNSQLAMVVFNTVADNTVLVAQPPREVERMQLTLTDQQLWTTFLIFVIGLPLIGVAVGVSMWWTRRQ